jgi:hypothetical protein
MVTKDDLKDELKAALEPITKTLDDHTRRLTTIENDVTVGLFFHHRGCSGAVHVNAR